jgi:hypothetical protein
MTEKPEGPAERGKRLFEKEEAEGRAAAKKFDPKLLVKKATEKHMVLDGDEEIYYYPLVLEDTADLSKAKTNEEYSTMMLWKMLEKAYPELTLEDVKKFPMGKGARILQLLSEAEGFLPPEKKSTVSSSTAKMHK